MARKQQTQAAPKVIRERKRGGTDWLKDYLKKNGIDTIDKLIKKNEDSPLVAILTELLMEYEAQGGEQRFDPALKNWISKDPKHIIPYFLNEAIFLETKDIERIRPTLRNDRVFFVIYNGKKCVLNFEFETGY